MAICNKLRNKIINKLPRGQTREIQLAKKVQLPMLESIKGKFTFFSQPCTKKKVGTVELFDTDHQIGGSISHVFLQVFFLYGTEMGFGVYTMNTAHYRSFLFFFSLFLLRHFHQPKCKLVINQFFKWTKSSLHSKIIDFSEVDLHAKGQNSYVNITCLSSIFFIASCHCVRNFAISFSNFS